MFPQGVLIRFMQGKQCQVEGKIAKAIGEKRYIIIVTFHLNRIS